MSDADEQFFDSQISSPEIRSELMHLVTKRRVPESDREDVVSDVFERAVLAKAKFDPARGTLQNWISWIAENVVRTYFRRKSAQKRRAPGGTVLSLDDINEIPAHSGGYTISQEQSAVPDLVDRASLSEKERQAILSPGNHNQNVSFSTRHRAIQKVRQIRSDDEFRENCECANASGCEYGKIKPSEHMAALLYDFSRKTSWFVEAVNGWRKIPEWNELQSDLQSKRTLRRFPLNVPPSDWPEDLHRYYRHANERSPQLRTRFEAVIEIALSFPEWPAVGFCNLDPVYRRPRLQEFGWVFEEEPFWDITDATYEIFIDAGDTKMPGSPAPSQLSSFLEMINKAPQNGSDSYNSVHLIRIDWRYPLKTLVRSFKKWAATQPKQNTAKIQSAGRPRTRLLLGYAFNRLTKEFGMNAFTALSWLKKNYGSRVPTSPETLNRTAERARNYLKNVLPPPNEIGL